MFALFLEMFDKHKKIMEPVKDLPSLEKIAKDNPNLSIKDVGLKKEEEVNFVDEDTKSGSGHKKKKNSE